jgi:16S rRNA (guanine527-N7)-methyltransferase
VLEGVLDRARSLGLLGPTPIPEQIAHARALGATVPPGLRCVDLGSGGGLPALPLALAWPPSEWWLVESSSRRAAFLESAVHDLDLADRVEVLHQPAEEVGRGPLRTTADRVTARSFGPPATTAECAAPLLVMGGLLLVSEPPGADGSRWDGLVGSDLGLRLIRVVEAEGATVAVLEKEAVTRERYPRRSARKRPLF